MGGQQQGEGGYNGPGPSYSTLDEPNDPYDPWNMTGDPLQGGLANRLAGFEIHVERILVFIEDVASIHKRNPR